MFNKLWLQQRWKNVKPSKYSISNLSLLGPCPQPSKKGAKKRAVVKGTLISVHIGTSLKQPGISWWPFRGRSEQLLVGVRCTESFPRVSSIISHFILTTTLWKEHCVYSSHENDLHAADGGGPLFNSNPCPVHCGLHPVKGLSTAKSLVQPSLCCCPSILIKCPFSLTVH